MTEEMAFGYVHAHFNPYIAMYIAIPSYGSIRSYLIRIIKHSRGKTLMAFANVLPFNFVLLRN